MAHWFYMCLSEEGHILVSTLRNHMKQNNDFIKAVLPEYHLPPTMRMTLPKRIWRLITYILLVFTMSAQITQYGFAKLEAGSSSLRFFCYKACQTSHFPSLSCGPLPDHKITLHGNTYSSLWKFQRPDQPFNDTNIGTEHFNKCRDEALNPKEVEQMMGLERKQRMHVCWSECRRSSETPEAGYAEDTRSPCMCERYTVDPVAGITALRPCPDGAEGCIPCDSFRDLICVSPKDKVEWPNTWGMMCADDEGLWCMSWQNIFLVIAISNCLQLAFEWVLILNSEESEDVYEFQSAVYKCGWQAVISITFIGLLLCTIGPYGRLLRLDRIETLWMTFMVSLSLDQVKNIIVQPMIWWLFIRRCGRVNPGIQEYNEEYILQWETQESLVGEMQRKVDEFLQWRPIMLGIIGLVGFYSLFVLSAIATADTYRGIKVVEDTFKYGDFAFLCIFMLEIVLKTFAYGLKFLLDLWNIFDASIVIVSFLFFFLPTGASSSLTLLRLLRLLRVIMVVRKVSEQRKKLQSLKKSSGAFDIGSNVDKVMELLEELLAHKALEPHQKAELDWVMEMITSNKLYSVSLVEEEQSDKQNDELNAWLYTSDASGATGAKEPTMGQGITGRATVMQSNVKESDQKKAARDSTLSSANAPAAGEGGAAVRSSRMVKGNNQVRSSAARGSRRQSRRQSEQKSRQEGSSALHIQLYTTAELTPAEEDLFEESLEAFSEWTLDILKASSILDVHLIPIIFFKSVIHFELMHALKFDFDLMYHFCSHVQGSFHPQVKFHGTPHTADMLHSCHYMLTHGLETTIHNPLDKFTLLFSALIAHAAHPGLTNDFLIKCRHPWAIMYNDKAVTQNHSLAAFMLALSDPELNFMLHLRPEQVDQFRRVTIQNVLKLDLRAHFLELSLFTTKLASETFPSDSQEDRNHMMSVALRVADLSWTCRPLQTYLKWSEKFLEEYFVQGDLEKQIGLGVSCFCDRDVVNTTKTNLSFTMVVAMPVMTTFVMLLDNADAQHDMITEGLEKNRAYLQSWAT